MVVRVMLGRWRKMAMSFARRKTEGKLKREAIMTKLKLMLDGEVKQRLVIEEIERPR